MEKGFCASHDFLHHVSRSIILFSSFSSRFKAIEIFLVALPPPHNTISPCYCVTFYRCSLKSSWYTTHQYPRPSSLHRFFFTNKKNHLAWCNRQLICREINVVCIASRKIQVFGVSCFSGKCCEGVLE